MIARLGLSAVVALVVALRTLDAQTTSQSTAAAISGVVLSTDDPAQPVRRATVTVTGGSIPSNLSAITDDDGRFRFVDLPGGRYSVGASKAAYLATMYGATKPGRQGTPINLANGQHVEIRLRLPKGAVIAGTVRDSQGQPLTGMELMLALAETATGASGYAATPISATTDDRGEYRIFGLQPGEYLVYALPTTNAANGEVVPLTSSEFDAKVRLLEQRGAPSVTSKPAASPTPTPTFGFAPTFYPSTPVAADAVPIKVAAGEERAGVNIVFAPVPSARVSGVIQGAGVPISRLIPAMTMIGPSMPLGFRLSPSGPNSDDGIFSFSNITPGRYVLIVRSGQGAMMRNVERNGGSSTNPDIPSMFAMQELTITGRNIDGVVLALRPAIRISGTVTFDATTKTKPDSPAGIGVLLNAVGPSLTTVASNSFAIGPDRPPSTSAGPSGGFQLVGVLPGTYTLNSSPPTGWWLRSAMVSGRDLLDDLIEIHGGSTDISGVVLTFSDRASGIQGTLSAASGQPAPEFTVIAFPTDRAFWKSGARRIKTTRPSSDGSFSLSMLPPGEYFLAALTDIEPCDAHKAAFLEQLVPAAVKVTVTEGQQTRQDLRIAK